MVKNLPLVSVITVSFNSAHTIEQTITSVINQTYSHIEYLIIDGVSTDGTIEIIEKYQDKIAFWISEPDKGIYDAMNKGIQMAKGEIIGIINSDDWYEMDAVEKVVKAWQKNKKDSVIHGGVHFIENEKITKNYAPHSNELIHCMIPHPACFIAQKAYKAYGLYDTKYRYAADYDLLLRLKCAGVKFHHLPEILANFRNSGASVVNYEAANKESTSIFEKHRSNPVFKSLLFKHKIKKTLKSIKSTLMLSSKEI